MPSLRSDLSRRVLYIHPSDEMYGADRVLLEVINAVDWPQPHVWLPTDVSYPERRLTLALEGAGVAVRHVGLPILRRSLRPLAAPRLVVQLLLAWLRILRLRPDVVYLNSSATLLLAPAARLAGARVVLHVHEHWEGREATVLGGFARFCERLICVSDAVRRQLPPALQSRSVVLFNGFPAPEPTPPSGDTGQPLTFVVASRWNAWKGHEVLLSAWDQMTGHADRRLLVLGGPPPSGAAFDVAQFVSRMRHHDTVEVVGEVDDATPYLRESDVVLVPSIRPDPLPTVAIEAAAAGRAVVASDIGGLPEIIRDGETGVLVPAGDLTAWARTLGACTREEAHLMGMRARQRYEELFDPTRFREGITAIMEDVLRSPC